MLDWEWGFRPARGWWVPLKAGALSLGEILEASCSRELPALMAGERVKCSEDLHFIH